MFSFNLISEPIIAALTPKSTTPPATLPHPWAFIAWASAVAWSAAPFLCWAMPNNVSVWPLLALAIAAAPCLSVDCNWPACLAAACWLADSCLPISADVAAAACCPAPTKACMLPALKLPPCCIWSSMLDWDCWNCCLAKSAACWLTVKSSIVFSMLAYGLEKSMPK